VLLLIPGLKLDNLLINLSMLIADIKMELHSGARFFKNAIKNYIFSRSFQIVFLMSFKFYMALNLKLSLLITNHRLDKMSLKFYSLYLIISQEL
jgi:hypothetical protein